MADQPNYDQMVATLATLGAEELAGLIVRSLTSAGAVSEWDSETIELVLSEYQDVLAKLGLPWVGDVGHENEDWIAWVRVARELDYYDDYPHDLEEDDGA